VTTTYKQFVRSVVGLGVLAALGILGACGSSAPVTPGGKAGTGGKAGASAAAGSTGAAGEASGAAGDTTGAAGTSTGAAGTSTGAAGDSTGAAGAVPTNVGPSGGMVTASGATLMVPSGALAATTPITLAPTNDAPQGYTLASAVYEFGPAGTTFAQPVQVEIPLSAATPDAHLFWSNAAGGYDDIGGTVVGMTITGMVNHFSKGFAATVVTAHDAGVDAPIDSSGGSAGSGGGSAGSGAAGATVNDGGAGSPGADASADDGGSAGSVDASAPIDAASLCASYALNAPVFQPTLVTDGGTAPAASTYSGGVLPSGQFLLNAVTHYGSAYTGPIGEAMIYDANAHTLRIIDRVQAVQFYIGLENVRNSDQHTIVGDVVCNTYPNQGNISQKSWSYSYGQKLVLSPVGSSDVMSYLVQLAP
jgi:hypothetical protein